MTAALDFITLLEKSVDFHGHLCSGQLLGVRMAMAGLRELGMVDPANRRNLVVFIEIDRCIADAIIVVTGCRVGRRSLKVVNNGKFAATFVDTSNGNAVRVSSKIDARKVYAYSLETAKKIGLMETDEKIDESRMHAKSEHEKAIAIKGCSIIPDKNLLVIEKVKVKISEFDLPGEPKKVVACSACNELIFDCKEVSKNGLSVCRDCASISYYEKVEKKGMKKYG